MCCIYSHMLNDAPCDDCEHSPCSYVTVTHCEKFKEWLDANEIMEEDK